MPTASLNRIVWAVDPFAENWSFQRAVGEAAAQFHVPVLTICLVPDSIDPNQVGPRMSELVAHGPARILAHEDRTLSTAVRHLISHAMAENAGLIVTGTRAGREASLFLLGSFTESLILQSPLPTLVVNPFTEPVRGFRRVLFPTNLGEASWRSFPKLLETSRALRAPIHLFHQLPAGAERDRAIRVAEEWRRHAADAGVPLDLEIASDGAPLKEAILKRVTEGDLLALASDGSPGHVRALGSVTRPILHQSPCPVWVTHTDASMR